MTNLAEKLPSLRHLRDAIEKSNPFGDGPSLVRVSIRDLEELMKIVTGETREWAEAIQRQRGYTNIYRHLWLSAERELADLRITLYGETEGIELDLGNEFGEELEALTHHRSLFPHESIAAPS